MAQFGASIQTAQVTTGNFQTTVDAFAGSLRGYPSYAGQKTNPGAAYYDNTGTNSNPWGVPGKYRYVRYSSTSNPALTGLTAPAPVYWTDNTYTMVSAVSSEGIAGINLVAGILMPNTTALTNLVNIATNAITQVQLNGNWCWICVGGFISGVLAPASTAAGDAIIGSTTTFAAARVAAGTAPTNRVIGYATSAIGTPATGQMNLLVTLES